MSAEEAPTEPTAAAALDMARSGCPDPRAPGRRPLLHVFIRGSLHIHYVRLHDLSKDGMMELLLEQQVSVGTTLVLKLPGHRLPTSCFLSAKACQCTPRPEGLWLVRCRLSRPLSPAEIQGLG